MEQILFFLMKRIYIKKVQKFPDYRVPTDPKIDRKIIRMEQEKAFNLLKKNLVDAGGVLRYDVYIVLVFTGYFASFARILSIREIILCFPIIPLRNGFYKVDVLLVAS